MSSSSPDSLLEARRLLERAIELDPGFALGYARLADLDIGEFRYFPEHDTELLDRAETYARRALALDPRVSRAHFSLGHIRQAQGKPTEAIREFRRAIELNPSSDYAHRALGESEMRLGRFEEAKRSFDRVQQLDPRVSQTFFWLARGTLHYLEGEIEQAVALWERARTMGSLILTNRIMLSHYYESAGRHEDAQAIVQEMLSAQPEITAELGVEMLARWWNEEWIPQDLEVQLRRAGLP